MPDSPSPTPAIREATRGRRLAAWGLDLLIAAAVLGIPLLLFGLNAVVRARVLVSTGSPVRGAVVAYGALITGALVGLLWFAMWEAIAGRTPGKWLMRLRVIRAIDGRKPRLRDALVRTLGWYLPAVVLAPFGTLVTLGLVWNGRGWHNRLADTRVIDVRRRELPAAAPATTEAAATTPAAREPAAARG